MQQQDWLLRIIEQIAEAIGAYLRGEDRQQLEDAVQELAGLSLEQLDRMPAPLLVRMVRARPDGAERRLAALADVLDALGEAAQATDPERAAALRTKASALRG